ncbi:MAG: hypothetical protein KC476_04295 [Cyanobacteria bacterium HKST-UBA06]|nr:hypothetical protein [Cyanobacteria bacterium HKST-UBA06]
MTSLKQLSPSKPEWLMAALIPASLLLATALTIGPAHAYQGGEQYPTHQSAQHQYNGKKGQFKNMSPDQRKAFKEQKRAEFAKKLNLTQQQQDQLKAAWQEKRDANQGQRDDRMAERQALQKLIQEKGKDDPTVQAKLADLKAKREARMAERDATMKSILTPEQFEQFQQMKADQMAKHKQFKDRRNHGGWNQNQQ